MTELSALVCASLGLVGSPTSDSRIAIEEWGQKFADALEARGVVVESAALRGAVEERQRHRSATDTPSLRDALTQARRLAEHAVEAWRSSANINGLVLLPWQECPTWMVGTKEAKAREWAGPMIPRPTPEIEKLRAEVAALTEERDRLRIERDEWERRAEGAKWRKPEPGEMLDI